MKAPSEEHLESWILRHPERFGPPAPSHLFPDEHATKMYRIDLETVIVALGDRLIGRQVRVTSGIMDLLYADDYTLTVVELKKDAVTYRTVGQCLRYMNDLWSMLERVHYNLDFTSKRYRHYRQEAPSFDGPSILPEISGVLVGHSVEDAHLVNIADAVGLRVYTYEFENDEYRFREHTPHDEDVAKSGYTDHTINLDGLLERLMERIIRNRSEFNRVHYCGGEA